MNRFQTGKKIGHSMVQKITKAWMITTIILFFCCSESLALFENEGLGARYLSLGGGCTALSDEPSTMAANPGGLGFYSRKGIELSWSRLFNLRELSSGDFYFVYPLKRFSSIKSLTFGLGLNVFGQSDYYQESKISFASGVRITDALSIGISVKYMKVSFASPYPGLSAIGIDWGVLIRIQDRIQIGGVIENLNRPQVVKGWEDVPRIWHLGFAIFPFEEVILAIDLAKDSEFAHQLKFGQEIRILKKLALRFGMATEPVTYGVGAGFEWEKVKMDYAFLSHPTLAESHKVSLCFEW